MGGIVSTTDVPRPLLEITSRLAPMRSARSDMMRRPTCVSSGVSVASSTPSPSSRLSQNATVAVAARQAIHESPANAFAHWTAPPEQCGVPVPPNPAPAAFLVRPSSWLPSARFEVRTCATSSAAPARCPRHWCACENAPAVRPHIAIALAHPDVNFVERTLHLRAVPGCEGVTHHVHLDLDKCQRLRDGVVQFACEKCSLLRNCRLLFEGIEPKILDGTGWQESAAKACQQRALRSG